MKQILLVDSTRKPLKKCFGIILSNPFVAKTIFFIPFQCILVLGIWDLIKKRTNNLK